MYCDQQHLGGIHCNVFEWVQEPKSDAGKVVGEITYLGTI